jgi:hypothetical protein
VTSGTRASRIAWRQMPLLATRVPSGAMIELSPVVEE